MKNRDKSKIKYFDYSLLLMVVLLVCFGLVMLYSTSAYTASNNFGTAFRFVQRQAYALAGGTIVGVVLMFTGLEWIRKIRLIAFWLTFALCVYVDINGANYSGSSRWINLGFFNFQPSELAKLVIILVLAHYISIMPKQIKTLKTKLRLAVFVIIMAVPVVVENLTTGAIIVGIGLFMIFMADFNFKHFMLFVAVLLVALAAFAIFVGYRKTRIDTWLNPEGDLQGSGYQTMQALYAIGSGGLFGKGLGNGIQKLGNLPEAENDMIFSIICEELGLFGAICVVLLFVVLLWRIMLVCNNAKNLYGSMICAGVFAQIAIQVVLNIAVVTNTLPNTGVSLPFISYGGSSILVLMIEMGMVLSVSRSITFDRAEVSELASE